MPLLNYTTQIPAAKTVGEVMGMLAAHGARAILTEYDERGEIVGLSFQIPHGQMTLQFTLPIKPEAVLRVVERDRQKRHTAHIATPTHTQAVMTAWRIVKDWVEAQMALLETEQVDLEQIFLPYLILNSGKTLYEGFKEKSLALPVGRPE